MAARARSRGRRLSAAALVTPAPPTLRITVIEYHLELEPSPMPEDRRETLAERMQRWRREAEADRPLDVEQLRREVDRKTREIRQTKDARPHKR